MHGLKTKTIRVENISYKKLVFAIDAVLNVPGLKTKVLDWGMDPTFINTAVIEVLPTTNIDKLRSILHEHNNGMFVG